MKNFFNHHTLTPLGGLNNSNYHLSYFNKNYALKIPDPNSPKPFKNQHLLLNLIAENSLSPRVIYYNKTSGILLTPFIEDANLSFDTFKSKEFLSLLINPLKKLHTLNFTQKTFNPFFEIRKNFKFLKDTAYDFEHPIEDYLSKLHKIESLYKTSPNLGLCHNDLNASNILFKNKTILFIDFEFSGICDIFFDLATLSWFLSASEKEFLLKSYFGYMDTSLISKLENYLYVVKLWNASWSLKKSLSSHSLYDYRLGGNMILDSLKNFSIKTI